MGFHRRPRSSHESHSFLSSRVVLLLSMILPGPFFLLSFFPESEREKALERKERRSGRPRRQHRREKRARLGREEREDTLYSISILLLCGTSFFFLTALCVVSQLSSTKGSSSSFFALMKEKQSLSKRVTRNFETRSFASYLHSCPFEHTHTHISILFTNKHVFCIYHRKQSRVSHSRGFASL